MSLRRRNGLGGKSVLIIVQNLPVPFDRRVWQECLTLRNAGYEVSVVCPRGKGLEGAYEELDGVRIWRHGIPKEGNGLAGFALEYSWSLIAELRLAIRAYRDRRFQVIQACNPPETIFLVALLFRVIGGCRFIFDHHDVSPELFEAKGGSRRSPVYWLLRLLERATFAAADVSIATNESYRDVAISRGKMSPDNVFVVRSGPDLQRIRAVEPDLALKQGRNYMLAYVGVIGKQEGIDLLLESFHLLLKNRSAKDVLLTIVGDGPELPAAKALSAKLGLDDDVVFTGRVPDAELVAVLSTADICVNPDSYSRMNDMSTMNKIVEYMAIGKPIVQFDLREGRVSAGEGSLYAKPDDVTDFANCVETLLGDSELREKMGAVGRKRATNRLSWEHQVPVLLRAYEAAAGWHEVVRHG